MKRNKLAKIIATSLIAISIIMLNQIGANAEWKKDSNGWWNSEENSYSIGWKEINGKWYYFGQDGYMLHDTIIDGFILGSDGSWIQTSSDFKKSTTTNLDTEVLKNSLKTDGYPLEVRDTLYSKNSFSTGWKLVNGKYYYFNFEGALVKDELVDGYYLGKDGALARNKDKSLVQDFTLKTEKSSYPIGTENIRVYITNNTNLESSYGGMYYRIEKFENNEWTDLDFAVDASFIDRAALLNSKGTSQETCKLSILKDFKKLTPGKYKIVVELSNLIGYSHAAAEFDLDTFK